MMGWMVTWRSASWTFGLALLVTQSAFAWENESGTAAAEKPAVVAESTDPKLESSAAEKSPQNASPQNASPEPTAQEKEQDAADEAHTRTVTEMLHLHNGARSRYNLRPFRMNGKLNRAAQRFAEFMGRTRSFGHYADGRSPAARMSAAGYSHTSWAENIAWVGSRPTDAMNTWMNSGGHRANILSDHHEVGFGLYNGVWVAVFGNPSVREVEMIGGE